MHWFRVIVKDRKTVRIVASHIFPHRDSNRKKAQALGEIVATLARVPMDGKHLTGFVDSVELPIRRVSV